VSFFVASLIELHDWFGLQNLKFKLGKPPGLVTTKPYILFTLRNILTVWQPTTVRMHINRVDLKLRDLNFLCKAASRSTARYMCKAFGFPKRSTRSKVMVQNISSKGAKHLGHTVYSGTSRRSISHMHARNGDIIHKQ